MEEEVITQEIDIVKVILETINTLCSSLFSSIDKSIYPLLDKTVFIDSSITNENYIESIFGGSSGLIVLANALIIAFFIYFGIKRFTSYYTGNDTESIHKFVIRAFVVITLMNCSLYICNSMIDFNYNISEIILEIGKNNLGYDISFSTLLTDFNKSSSSSFNLFSIDGIMTTMVAVSSFSLILTFTARYIMIKLLIFLSPFCFLCMLTKETSGIFKSFLKSFIALLLVQFVVALLLLFPFAILKSGENDIMSKLFIIGSIFALLRSNQFVKEFINGTGISTDFNAGISGIKSLFLR